MTKTVIRAVDLDALDQGAFREALQRLENIDRTGDPVETIWRAEILVYLERMEEAREELALLPGDVEPRLALRAGILRAEIAFHDKNLDEAEQMIQPLMDLASELNDTQGHLRSALLYGRIALSRTDATEALSRLSSPRVLATVLGNNYYLGIIAHCRAHCFFELSQWDSALTAFAEALRYLQPHEGLKWEANCRTLRANLLVALDRSEEALTECDTGEQLGAGLGIVSLMLWARQTAARVLMQRGQYRQAIARLQNTVAWEKEVRSVPAELITLQMVASAQCESDLYDDARATAREVIKLASLASRPNDELDGRLLQAWASLRSGDMKASQELKNLLGVCDETGNDHQRAEVRLYLADGLCRLLPAEARTYREQANEFTSTQTNARLRKIARRIDATLTQGVIRLGPNGELIIDCQHQWPNYDEALETVKRHLVFGAVESSNGNRSEAGRKLGLTRSRLHDLWHQLNGDPIRPTHLD